MCAMKARAHNGDETSGETAKVNEVLTRERRMRTMGALSRMRLRSTLAAGARGSRPPNVACLAAGCS